VLAIAMAAFSPFLDLLVSAFGLDQQDWPARQRQNVQSIRIDISKTVEFPFDETIVTAIVSDPEIVSANIQSDHVLALTGLRLGHTILIVSGRTRQVSYALDVVRLPHSSKNTGNLRHAEQLQPFAGSQAFYFTPGNRDEPSSLLYTFDFRQQLQNQRTLRAAGELFRFFGDREQRLNAPLATVFGANRLMFGMDSRTTKLDLLDSQLGRSQIGFNGYTLRGLHFTSTPDSRWHGLEFFAGNARPQVAIFGHGDGRLAGVTFPVVSSRTVEVEVGAVWIAPVRRQNAQSSQRTFVWHTALRYSPDERTRMSGELAYSRQSLSLSGRVDLQRGPFLFSGELLHLSRNSPLIAIGAQPEGRTSAIANLQWTPSTRFNTVASYARTLATSGSTRAALNSRLLVVRTNYQPASGSLLSFIFKDQLVDLPVSPLIALPFNLENRSVGFKWNQRLNGNWANNLEANFALSREDNTQLQTNRGLNLREQLRYRWRHGSAEGFINFRSHTPSLDGLILRNPTLLPVDFRPAFAADPRGFLLRNRFALPFLLNGIELPATRETATGVNLQASFRRATFTGEAVRHSSTFAAAPQNDFEVSVTGNFRLDAANSLQARVSRLFGSGGISAQTAMTIGYVHRFGADSGGGFQFSKWLGFRRSRIQGRVFMDLNNNDQQESNENGIAGITVQLNTSRTVTTDARGNFKFESLEAGEYELTLLSNTLGATLRAGSMPHRISVSPRQTVTISLGLSNTGSVAGRVFNDLLLTGRNAAGDAPGLKAVALQLYQIDGNAAATKEQRSFYQTTNSNGDYRFRNLAPGRYLLQVDPNTLPENFHVPAKMSLDFTLGPLQNLYLDLPFSAQRAVSGLVYIDVDDDDRFDPRKDSIVPGARIVAGASEAMSNRDGLYLLRNLPAGPFTIEVYAPGGKLSGRVRVELAREPVFRTGVDLKIRSELSP
jgi:SdrD B-like domain/Pilus formation protein N terminal region